MSTPKADNSISNCSDFLSILRYRLRFTGPNPTVLVTVLGEFYSALSSVLSQEHADRVLNDMTYILFGSEDLPFLRPLKRLFYSSYLESEHAYTRRLLCFVRSDCGLSEDEVLAYVDGNRLRMTKDKIKPFRMDETYNDLVSGPFDSADVAYFHLEAFSSEKSPTYLFVHEIQHLADFKLIEDWVQANIQLLQKGQNADALFMRYASYTQLEQKVVILDPDFLSVFLETRGYAWYLLRESQALGNDAASQALLKNLENEFALRFQWIVANYKIDKYFLMRNRIHRQNVWKITMSWAQAMENTLAAVQ